MSYSTYRVASSAVSYNYGAGKAARPLEKSSGYKGSDNSPVAHAQKFSLNMVPFESHYVSAKDVEFLAKHRPTWPLRPISDTPEQAAFKNNLRRFSDKIVALSERWNKSIARR
ncbi:MAG: hypothetical protein HYY43_01140 [Deltaproteobacteria bacterium]|nr:hypothetical protein [Deltaproteobacteria bacterium]MBI2974183.1 hypothetical protein [Deltaproteobacteria bacterium]